MSDKDQPEFPPADTRTKLVETKERWARDNRYQSGLTIRPEARRERLPPGQHEVKNWPVLDLGNVQEIDPATWELVVDGAVEAPQRWSWADFLALPQIDTVSDIHCVTTWSRYDNRWQGVGALEVLARVRPRPEARHVLFHSYDGYTTNLKLSAFASEDVLLAHQWEGQPLTPAHGGPVRVVVPQLYFWKSAKWLQRIEFLTLDQPGFWEVRGYHNEADPWLEERYG